MRPTRRLAALVLVASVGLTFAALWLLLHNPSVVGPSTGEYTCAAPYDTVLAMGAGVLALRSPVTSRGS